MLQKYRQITIVTLLFGLMVWYRHLPQKEMGEQRISPPASPTPPTTPASVDFQALQVVYTDGTYIGDIIDAFYGDIQVQVTIAEGKLTDVSFLAHPNDNSTSQSINEQAMPLLRSEALASQSEHVDIVSGASESSKAFQKSLASALKKAKG